MEKMKALSKFIVDRRKAKKLSQADLASELTKRGYRYQPASVAHWESQSSPTIPPLNDPDFVAVLADVLGTTPQRLYEVTGILHPSVTDFDSESSDFTKFIEELTPDQKKIILDLIEQFKRQSGRDNS